MKLSSYIITTADLEWYYWRFRSDTRHHARW